jgi:hypothetical protein
MKFGDLLVKLGLVSEPDLRDALVVAPQFGLQSNYSVEQARTVAASVRQGTPPALALKNAGVEDSAEKTTLGQLLQESGLINAQQLDTAQKASYRSGMRLGRMLVLNGVITHAQLARALDVQFSIRERKITMQQGISMLQAQASQPVAYEAHQLRPAPAQKNVRFSEFLVLSGLLTDAEMLHALETSMDKRLSLAQTLIDQGSISKKIFDAATEMYNKVLTSEVALNDATSRVYRMVFGEPQHQQGGSNSPVLGELLKMTGVVDDEDINEAISLSNKYPSLIGKMLVLSGAIDEATLIASLRCQFLLKHGYLTVDDAINALQYTTKNKVSFDDALDELGIRKATPNPAG